MEKNIKNRFSTSQVNNQLKRSNDEVIKSEENYKYSEEYNINLILAESARTLLKEDQVQALCISD